MVKKILQAGACTLLLSLMIPIMAFAAEFSDVTKGNTFHKEIEALSAEKIISGYEDGSFKPNNVVTRAQAAVMLGKALGYSGEMQTTQFVDVTSDVTGAGYIAQATEQGIINGFTDGTFRPYAPVTRGQMAIFINRAFELAAGQENNFRDISPDMTSYQAIVNVTANRIASGYPDRTYRPNQSVTRGQFSAFMARALGLVTIPETSGLSDHEIKNLIVSQQEEITDVLYGHFGNPYHKVRPYFLQYATENFTNGDLRYIYENSCTECDSSYFPWLLELDMVFELTENSPNRIVVASAEIENEVTSGGFYTYTFVKENGKWLMDGLDYTSFSKKSLNLTIDKAKTIITKHWYDGVLKDITFVSEQLVKRYDYFSDGYYLANQYTFRVKTNNGTGLIDFYPDSGYYHYQY